MEFNILNEKNEFKLGTIITVFSLPNTPKEIVLFSVGDYDSSDTASLEVAYLNKDKDGYNYIEEIDDDRIVISEGTDGSKRVLTRQSSVSFHYEIEGREWSDGCVCDGSDYYAQIIWE